MMQIVNSTQHDYPGIRHMCAHCFETMARRWFYPLISSMTMAEPTISDYQRATSNLWPRRATITGQNRDDAREGLEQVELADGSSASHGHHPKYIQKKACVS